MNVAHITNIFRASLCLWCKVEDFSFFRYVHRHSAVVAQPVLVFPDSLEFSSQPVHSFVEFPLLEIRLIEAVSYTHLDVYKRQAMLHLTYLAS